MRPPARYGLANAAAGSMGAGERADGGISPEGVGEFGAGGGLIHRGLGPGHGLPVEPPARRGKPKVNAAW